MKLFPFLVIILALGCSNNESRMEGKIHHESINTDREIEVESNCATRPTDSPGGILGVVDAEEPIPLDDLIKQDPNVGQSANKNGTDIDHGADMSSDQAPSSDNWNVDRTIFWILLGIVVCVMIAPYIKKRIINK